MESDHYSALPVGYEIDGYRIEGVLGSGGFGITYLATELALGRQVAIKEFLPAALAGRAEDGLTVQASRAGRADGRDEFAYGLDRFRQEARTLVTFDHPNVVGVHRYVEANRTAYLIMQYLKGETLDETLHREGRIEEERLVAMAMQLLDGLAYVHGFGYLHRDIKPGNIYMTEDGRPVLLDFGAARQALTEHSRSLTAIVTAGYAPYEQYHSASRQGPYTDLYALGAVLYRCATGREPPEATARMSAVIRGRPDPLEPARVLARGEYSDRLLGAIDAAMAVAEDDRPQTVAALQAMLDGTAPVPGPIEPPPADVTLVAAEPPRDGARTSPVAAEASPDPDGPDDEETRFGAPPRADNHTRRPGRLWAILALALVLGGGGAGAAVFFLFDGTADRPVRPGPVERAAPVDEDPAPVPERDTAADTKRETGRETERKRATLEKDARPDRDPPSAASGVREALRERLADLILASGSYATEQHDRSYARVLLDEDGCGAIVERAAWRPGQVEGLDGQPALVVTYRLCLGDLSGASIQSNPFGGVTVMLSCRSPHCIAIRVSRYDYRSRENPQSGSKEITGHTLVHRDSVADRLPIQVSRGDPSLLLDFFEKSIQAHRD